MTRYQRPADGVTERVVSTFEDFEGWADGPPRTVRRKRSVAAPWEDESAASRTDDGLGTVRGADEPVGLVGPPVDEPTPPLDPLVRCPSCGCGLPDPNHLVSNSMLAPDPKGA